VRDAAIGELRDRDAGVLADLREAEAGIEHIRVDQAAKADALSAIQARFYEAGAEVTRIEQSIQHARELRSASRRIWSRPQAQVAGSERRDAARPQPARFAGAGIGDHGARPRCGARRGARASRSSGGCEQALAAWQLTWDAHANRWRRDSARRRSSARASSSWKSAAPLLQQQERQEYGARERSRAAAPVPLETLAEQRALARDAGEKAATGACRNCWPSSRSPATRARADPGAQRAARALAAGAQGSQVSTEALQQAALGKVSGKVTQWLKSKSLDQQPRVAQQLRVERGWERAVETVLGSYLEAVCVDGLDSVTDLLASFDGGHLAVVSVVPVRPRARDGGLAAGEGAGRTFLSSVLSRCTRPRRWARRCAAAPPGGRRIGGDARRHLAGQRLAARVARCAIRTPA
jgi:chromosome segregation protein